ncbi:hypothetical protein EAF00_004852 [Botryotinia globosa]|nr:hypothetical protein EAF00_004852 [Botryotinia globosa]
MPNINAKFVPGSNQVATKSCPKFLSRNLVSKPCPKSVSNPRIKVVIQLLQFVLLSITIRITTVDAKLSITSISQIPSAIVEASTMENNNMTSTPQESLAIPAATMENQDQTATTSLQLPTPSTGTTMSNITPTTSTTATSTTATSTTATSTTATPTTATSTTATSTTATPTTATSTTATSTTATIAPPTPSTSTTMSNITPTNAVVAVIPSAVYIGRLPIELRLPIYNSLLCMTVAGHLPPILRAFHGTSEYPLLQYLYKLINFILSNATLPIFWTITNRGKRLDKILYLHLRSDSFNYFGLEDNSRNLLRHHVCKLRNHFQKITFTAIQPTRTPHNSAELLHTNTNVSFVVNQLCDILNASVQACEFRFKFLGYNNGNLMDQSNVYNFVGEVSRRLRVTRRWTPRRELVGDDGLVHNGIVWIWEIL